MTWIALILAIGASAPMDGVGGDRSGPAAGDALYSCRFDAAADPDLDGWPNGWTRRRSRRFPPYVRIRIERPAPSRDGALRVDLDGAGAAVFAPPVGVQRGYTYVAQARMRTRALRYAQAVLEVLLCDEQGRPVDAVRSRPYGGDSDWTRVRAGPIAPRDPRIRSLVAGLVVRPGEQVDLGGVVWLDDLQLIRTPRLTLAPVQGRLVWQAGLGQSPELQCRMSGLLAADPEVLLEIAAADGAVVAQSRRRLSQLDGEDAVGLCRREASGGGDEVAFRWRPRLPGAGFYSARVAVEGGRSGQLAQTVPLVMLRQVSAPGGGPFGWSLPPDGGPLPLDQLSDLAIEAGVGWIKLPLDRAAGELAWGAEAAAMARRLAEHQVRLVGVVAGGADRTEWTARGDARSAAALLLDANRWRPALDAVLIRMGLYVGWWQLGRDGDAGFVDFPDLAATVQQVRGHMEQYGREVRLGLPWPWIHAPPSAVAAPWDFLTYAEDPPFTPRELRAALEAEGGAGPSPWIAIRPLDDRRYDLATRVRDLVLRMVAARIGGAEAVFASDVFDDHHGLLTRDGRPTELLPPWRTTALAIGRAEHLGSIQLPNGSRNEVFDRGGEGVMVVWSSRPAKEILYLGERLRVIDPWGREQAVSEQLEHGARRQVISVGPTPHFIFGVDLTVARWRMGFALETDQLASVFGRRQRVVYRFENAADRRAAGSIRFYAPPMWDVEPQAARFRIEPGATREDRFDVVLGADADSGAQPVRIEFDLQTNRRLRFSVYRRMRVGLGDVELHVQTRLDERGDLVVEQEVINHSDEPVALDCFLFAPHRRRQRAQVFRPGRGRSIHEYVLPGGAELLGKTIWIRAEQRGGDRVLNRRVTAAP